MSCAPVRAPAMPGLRAISRALGLFVPLAILFHSAWFSEPQPGPRPRRLLHGGSGTFLESLRSTWDQTFEDTSERLKPCLYAEVEHHLGALVSWVSSAAANTSDKFRWAFLEQPWVGASGLACAALLGAAAYALYVHVSMKHITDRGYHLLGVDEEESRERLQAQFGIAFSLVLSVADIVSDIYVATAYFRSGLIAFGSLLIAITLGSGVVGFVLHRASWERASNTKNVHFWAMGLNEQGQPKPGIKDLILYVLQIKPILVAYESLKLGSETVVLVREKVLAQLSESVPSSLLQAYALAVAGTPQEGTVFFLLLSLGISLGSMADAANKGYRRLCAPTIEPGALPEAGLLAWRCADVGGRICGWALLGMALRPVDASRRGIQQPWLPAWILVDIAVSAAIHKLVLRKAWENLKRPQDMLELLLSAVTIPWGCFQYLGCRVRRTSSQIASRRMEKPTMLPMPSYGLRQALLRRQLRLQRMLLLGRSLTAIAAAVVVAAKYGSTTPDGPLSARPALASLAAAAVAFSLATLLTAAVSEMLLCWNLTLFPVAHGLCSGPLHLSVRLGSVANVQHILAQTRTHDEGLLPAHEAAICGEVGVLIALKENCSEAMDAVDEQGRRPLHLAAASGSVDVLRFLAETQAVADSRDEKGITAAHLAAEMGHVDALQVLQQACYVWFLICLTWELVNRPRKKAFAVDFQARDESGETAAHKAARGGHAEARADLEAKDRAGRTPAHCAAAFGHLAALEALREAARANVELGAKDNDGNTPAWLAASEGSAAALRLLQEAGADLGAADDDGDTPTSMAAQNGHLEALQVLRQAQTSVTTSGVGGWRGPRCGGEGGGSALKDGTTPAHRAAQGGHLEVLRLLLQVPKSRPLQEFMPLPDFGEHLKGKAKSPLTVSVACRISIVRCLQAKADPAAADEEGWTPASLAAEKGHAGVLRLLQEAGADLGAAKDNGVTPAFMAAQNGHLEAGADLAAAAKDGRTPAHWAAQKGHPEALRLLLELLETLAGRELEDLFFGSPAEDKRRFDGSLVSAMTAEPGQGLVLDEDPRTVSVARRISILRCLQAKADPAAADEEGWTPASLAALNGHAGVLRLLQEAGADLAAAAKDGRTPAHRAAQNGHLEALRLLLEDEFAALLPESAQAGADLGAAKDNGVTPAFMAAQNGHLEALQVLRQAGADLAAARKDGATPAHGAAKGGHPEVLRLLLEARADVNATDVEGWTPVHLAEQKGHQEVLRFLQEASHFEYSGFNRSDIVHDRYWRDHAQRNKLESAMDRDLREDSNFAQPLSQEHHCHSKGEAIAWQQVHGIYRIHSEDVRAHGLGRRHFRLRPEMRLKALKVYIFEFGGKDRQALLAADGQNGQVKNSEPIDCQGPGVDSNLPVLGLGDCNSTEQKEQGAAAAAELPLVTSAEWEPLIHHTTAFTELPVATVLAKASTS
ncbi:ANK3 [Symbiodinium microadriaticum]|nr:ANK3 [Symbiodinium microadriaticum]